MRFFSGTDTDIEHLWLPVYPHLHPLTGTSLGPVGACSYRYFNGLCPLEVESRTLVQIVKVPIWTSTDGWGRAAERPQETLFEF